MFKIIQAWERKSRLCWAVCNTDSWKPTRFNAHKSLHHFANHEDLQYLWDFLSVGLAGGTELSTQAAEPGLHMAPVKCHSMDRNCWGTCWVARWQRKGCCCLISWSSKVQCLRTSPLMWREKSHPLVKPYCKNLWKTLQNTKTTTYPGTSLTGNREVISILLKGCSLASEHSTLSRNLRSFGFTYLALTEKAPLSVSGSHWFWTCVVQ